MSVVISFRLDPENPREAQALDILNTKQSDGFSRRRILTDALIGMVAPTRQSDLLSMDEFNQALEQVSGLLERLNGGIQPQNQPVRAQASGLNENFINSVRVAARPGISTK